MNYDRSNDPCPKCDGETHQDSVDVGVGVIYGPRGCMLCGWSEDPEYDLSEGKSPVLPSGAVQDQFGGIWPAGSTVAKAYRMAESFENREEKP